MRPLAQQGFTEAQVRERLFDPTATIGAHFDVLDRDGNLIEALPSGDAGVVGEPGGAVVTCNVDADIKTQLSMRMRPVESLRGKAFLRFIRPSFTLSMFDKVLSWPMGLYVWGTPQRDTWPGDEWWDVQLGDKSYLLGLGGPGPAGYTVKGGTLVSTAINQVLRLAGFSDTVSRVEAAVPKTMIWRLTTPANIQRWQQMLSAYQSTARSTSASPAARARALGQARVIARNLSRIQVENAPTKWLTIINDLCAAVGYDSLWFDHDGNPQIRPHRDLTTATPDFTFTSGMCASRVSTEYDHAHVANRVIVKATNQPKLNPVVVDANTVMPWHPQSQAKVGVYIDRVIDDDASVSYQAMTARGRQELFKAGGAYERVRVEVLCHPGLEAFDIVGLQLGDAEFGSGATLHVRQWAWDAWAGVMPLECSRVFTP